MTKIVISTIAASMLTSTLYAGGDIAPVEPEVEVKIAPVAEKRDFFKTVDGYVRAGYQADGDDATDLALGGKLHVETNAWYGLSAGASFYTTNVIGDNDGAGVPFFDANNKSYSILGEAYIKGEWGNTMLKIGRQEIDTPFLDTDDIGMVPNTYEAALLVNTDITDTTITVGHIERMAGVDADVDPSKFEDIRSNDYVQLVGIEYEVSENLALSGWYYNLKNPLTDNLVYADITYTGNNDIFAYEVAGQYAHRNLSDDTHSDADIYGAMIDISFEQVGINIGAAYNTAEDNYATNGFGGGPFYTSAEHLTLREANDDGDAVLFSAGWDASTVGLDGLEFGVGYLTLESNNGDEATELDLTASYAFNDALSVDVIYSDIEDDINGDTFENTRVFVNYIF